MANTYLTTITGIDASSGASVVPITGIANTNDIVLSAIVLVQNAGAFAVGSVVTGFFSFTQLQQIHGGPYLNITGLSADEKFVAQYPVNLANSTILLLVQSAT